MTSYTKWDRDAYIERVGGPEEAERRRKTLMARQSGQRLADERKQRRLTQAQLAETMGVTPGRVSQIERGELSTIGGPGKPVPNQVPTRADSAGPSRTFPDIKGALICGNRTSRDALRRNRAAWHAEGQGFEFPSSTPGQRRFQAWNRPCFLPVQQQSTAVAPKGSRKLDSDPRQIRSRLRLARRHHDPRP